MKPARPPLEGVRIVELTHAVAGPVTGFILGDMGAEVIKVEAPNARHSQAAADSPPPPGGPDRPYNRVSLWTEMNRSKQSLVLDLSRPQGRDLLLQLVEKSDIVVENFSPRVLRNLKIEYEDMISVNPNIVVVSMPAFGRTGQYRDRRSYGPGIDAMSGLSHLTGYVDGGPLKPGNFYCDYNAGVLAAFAALAALWHRRRTGEGQYVEVAMIEGELQLVGSALIDYFMNGRDQSPLGNHHPTMAPHGSYRCTGEDRWITIACRSDDDFVRLCQVIGRRELASDPRFVNVVVRKAHENELDDILGRWTASLSNTEAMRQLQEAGVPAGAALDVSELFNDRHIQARGVFHTVEHPEIGSHPHTRVAWRSEAMPQGVTRHAPLFGEHSDQILRRLLGLSPEDIRKLVEDGIVTREPVGPR